MPMTRRSPSVTGETQPIIRIVEVLPAPLGPRNPNDSPGATSKSMASTAVNVAEALGQAAGMDERGVGGLGHGRAWYRGAHRDGGCAETCYSR